MGKNTRLRFHRFRWNNLIDVVVIEPRTKEYVWLSFYIDARFRNGFLSLELIKYLIRELKGVHHIHPLNSAKTFHDAACQLGWRKGGLSLFFEDCCAYRATFKSAKTPLYPLFSEIIKHSILNRLPVLRTFANQKEAKFAVEQIVNHYSSDKRAC